MMKEQSGDSGVNEFVQRDSVVDWLGEIGVGC